MNHLLAHIGPLVHVLLPAAGSGDISKFFQNLFDNGIKPVAYAVAVFFFGWGAIELMFPNERSQEYGSYIIEAITLHRPTVIYGNVRNTHLIDNLPDGCVEVPCLVDRNGIQPIHVDALPEQLAALNRAHMAVHQLVTQALVQRDKEAARYALLLDPLTAAVCSPAEISALFDEMWAAEAQYLTGFD